VNIIQQAADLLIRDLFHADPAHWPWAWLVHAAVIGVAAFLAFVFVAIFAGPVSWIERRIAARIQSRIGPNRVGPQGILQWLADGLKCWLKEDLVPATADKPLFLAAPYLVFTGMFGAFVVLPFGANIVAADLNVGILYILAITSLVVVGLLMAGWGSNSKWALFGGVRSAAQLVSYEVPTAFSLLCVVLLSGTLSTQGIVAAQGGWPWQWFIFRNPFMFAAFFLYFTSAIAEGNRTPFDLPEAESEIIAGYNIEYSGMRFLFFLFAEWANIWIMTAIATFAFLGGWQIPGVSPQQIAATTGWVFVGWQVLSWTIFLVKATFLVFVVIQIRWTLPRLRVDQLMITCWKYLVPMSMAMVLGVLLLLALVPENGIVDKILRYLMVAVGLVVVLVSVLRVRQTFQVDRVRYREMEGRDLWYPPYRLP
jgi:NADH-quinone oxidoreductase subunit H